MCVRSQPAVALRSTTIARAEKFNADDVLATIADKWEETENKSTVITYVAGATAVAKSNVEATAVAKSNVDEQTPQSSSTRRAALQEIRRELADLSQ